MISVSKMKNSVHNLIGLEDSCISEHYLTDFFCQLRLLKTHKYSRKWQIAVFGLTCTADKWTSGLEIKLLWKHEVQLQGLSQTGFGRGCQCAKGTQDTESSIWHDTLKPDGVLITSTNKEIKRKLHTIFWGSCTCHLDEWLFWGSYMDMLSW